MPNLPYSELKTKKQTKWIILNFTSNDTFKYNKISYKLIWKYPVDIHKYVVTVNSLNMF